MQKQLAKDLQGDYIPGGLPVDLIDCTDWRRTAKDEIRRCCCTLGDDIQSGPIFCGDIADFVATSPRGCLVALCETHTPRRYREAGEAAEKVKEKP